MVPIPPPIKVSAINIKLRTLPGSFGEEYINYSDSFLILIFGVTGIFIFRGVYGNLLSSIGKMSVNYYIVSIAILINILSNFYLIPIYGIKGAAVTSSTLMWFTGIASWVCFNYLYKKKTTEKTK